MATQCTSSSWWLETSDFQEFLDNDTKVTTSPVDANSSNVTTEVTVYRYEHHVVTESQQVIGIYLYKTSIGEERTSWALKIDAENIWQHAGTKVFRCTRDSLSEIDTITGERKRIRVWEHISPRTPYAYKKEGPILVTNTKLEGT